MTDPRFDPFDGLSTGEAQVVAAIALLVVAAVAAVIAYRAMRETRRSREQSVRPVLALDLAFESPLGHAKFAIVNVGQGAALDCDLELAYLPGSPMGETPVCRPWQWPMIAPGTRYAFNPPDIDGQFPTIGELADVYSKVRLSGTVRDQSGGVHEVDVMLEDLVVTWDFITEADQAWKDDPTPKVLAKIADELDTLEKRVGHVAAAIGERSSPG